MKNLGLSSRYASVSMWFAALSFCFGILFLRAPELTNSLPVIPAPTAPAWPHVILAGEDPDATPCYSVYLDASVPGGTARRTALGRSLTAENAAFMQQLESYLLDRLTDESWQRNRACIEGSFVVNFSVREDGSIGNTKMLHHQIGGGARVGIDIFQILDHLDREGVRWHDGTLGAGEIILPIRFRIG